MDKSVFIPQRSCDLERIYRFLCKVDSSFVPSLASRVDIRQYADKLSKKACNIFLTCDQEGDVAHVALYLNSDSAFITSVAVLAAARGNGLARILMNEALIIAKSSGCKSVSLEVEKSNYVAQNLYQSYGFFQTPEDAAINQIIMKTTINE